MKIITAASFLTIFLAALIVSSPHFAAAAGKSTFVLDQSFKLNKKTFSFAGVADEDQRINKMVRTADGGVLLAGTFSSLNHANHSRLLKLTPSLSIDSSFAPSIDGEVYDLAIAGDGKIYIVGDFTQVDSVSRRGIARLSATGSLDLTFDPGAGANGSIKNVTQVIVQSDGSVIIFGTFSRFNARLASYSLVKLNLDGSVNDTFIANLFLATLNDGSRSISVPESIESVGADKILVVGFGVDNSSSSTDGFEGSSVVNADGTRTETIKTAAQLLGSYIHARGSAQGSGFISHEKFDARFTPITETLYRFDATGTIDPSFSIQQKKYFNTVSIDPVGMVLVAPQTASIKSGRKVSYSATPTILRYSPAGQLQTMLRLPQMKKTALEYKQILTFADSSMLIEMRTVTLSKSSPTGRTFKHFLIKVKKKH